MKILMLNDFYFPIVDGTVRHINLLSKGLTERGHKVVICTTGNKNLPIPVERKVKIVRIMGFSQRIPFLFKDPSMRHHPPVKDWMISRQLEKIIEIEKPDIIHIHGLVLYSTLGLRNKHRIPLVVTLHDFGFFCPKRTFQPYNGETCKPFTKRCVMCGKNDYGPLKSFLAYYGVKLNRNKLGIVDRFVAVSPFVKRAYSLCLGLNDEKVTVVPNFYDVDEVNSLGNGPRMFSGKDFILFVGNLHPFKGVDVLVKAYRKINARTKLVLIGMRHPDYNYDIAEDISVIKNAPHELVMEAFSKCRFVVIPSIIPEASPTVAFEAMSCKKAIIASSIGGLKDIVVDGETGILVHPNDSEELAKAANYLLHNSTAANEMGEKGFQRLSEKFNLDIVLPQIEKIYRNCLSNIQK